MMIAYTGLGHIPRHNANDSELNIWGNVYNTILGSEYHCASSWLLFQGRGVPSTEAIMSDSWLKTQSSGGCRSGLIETYEFAMVDGSAGKPQRNHGEVEDKKMIAVR